MSADYTWNHHIGDMVRGARNAASWVLGVFKNRSTSVMLQLYKSLVRCRVEYCCPLWNPLKVDNIQKVEDVQRNFTRRFAGLQNLNYWQRLSKLKLLSLQRRRERYMIIHVWKISSQNAPNDINMEFRQNSRLGIRVKIPPFLRTAPQLDCMMNPLQSMLVNCGIYYLKKSLLSNSLNNSRYFLISSYTSTQINRQQKDTQPLTETV